MSLKGMFQLVLKDYWRNIQKRESLAELSTEYSWYESLIHFKDYAYERNMTGATSHYKAIADVVLEPLRNRESLSTDSEHEIWNNFKKQCLIDGIKHNEQVDPLKPSSNKKKSLERFVWDITTTGENHTISTWAFNMLNEDKLKEAHSQLKTVWGVGDKIASFYLRDIFWLGSNLSPNKPLTEIKNLHLIQPVDIWIERAAEAIGFEGKSKTEIAKAIALFEQNLGLPPGGGNIGFWMLGSNYLGDINTFSNVISATYNPSEASKENALAVADYYVDYYGKFGELLKSSLA